jgi:transaldolase
VLSAVYGESAAVDGRVSLEVDPRLAFDTTATVAAASRIWANVERPNVMVKIPATAAGLPAITETLAAGISVNVTLIFGVDRYREVQEAWLAGLEAARGNGRDLASIGSVASFFVSRLDTAVDGRLDADAASGALTTDQHQALRGRAAVANARTAYRQFDRMLADPRWTALAAAGAQPQRPLWASTSTKDPTFSPTRYVDELVAPQTVNTMPSATLAAVADSAVDRPVTIGMTDADAADDAALFAGLAEVGVDYDTVVAELEEAGVASFIDAWERLLQLVAGTRRA